MGTVRMIEAFVRRWPGSESGPAHIVLGDYNLQDDHIHWCREMTVAALSRSSAGLEDDAKIILTDSNWYEDHSQEELRETLRLLDALLLIPEEQRTGDRDGD